MKTRVTIEAFILLAGALGAGAAAVAETTADKIFRLHEVTIDGIHAGIQSGATTCKGVVEAYVARARAYNGTCTMPVTADGGAVPKVKGAVRAGAPVTFSRPSRWRSPSCFRISRTTSASGRTTDAWNPPCRTRRSISSTAWSSAFRTPNR